MYTDDEVGKILKRAAGLQREHVPGVTLTQSEIEKIASDAGIDPAKVQQAIAELHQPQDSSFAKTMLGAPTRISIERIIPGELDPKHHDTLALAIRRLLQGASGPGLPSTVGRTLTYVVANRNAPLEISITASGGNTVVRIDLNQRNLAGGIFGGLVGGIGGSVGPNLAWLLPFSGLTSVPVGIAAGLGLIGVTWLGCRMLYRAIAGSQQRKLGKLADALEQQVRAMI